MRVIRPATPADASALFALRAANRAYLERWEPDADPPARRSSLAHIEDWTRLPLRYVILDGDAIAGGLSLSNVVEDVSLRSAMVGYWVAQTSAGKGLATQAVAAALDLAFGELSLHRVEAGTDVHNAASQRVLEKNGFTRVGVLRRHMRIGGVWRDHYLYERLADD